MTPRSIAVMAKWLTIMASACCRPPLQAARQGQGRGGRALAQSYILGRLRNRTFFSLAEANAAIVEALERMNGAVMRRVGISRRQLFETVEMAALDRLPAEDFVAAEWLLARAGIDYHVEVHGFFYSVPYGLVREQVDVRVTQRTIEIFHKGGRVAAHERRYGGAAHGTDPAHMPKDHRGYASWTTDRFRSWAAATGPNMEALILAVIASRRHPQQGFRTCLGVLRHIRGLPKERVEEAAARAVAIGALSYKAIVGLIDAEPRRRPPDEESMSCSTRIFARTRILPMKGAFMLNHPTLDLLHELGLHGMAKGFKDLQDNPEAAGLNHAEWLGLVLDREALLRRQKRFEARAKAANLRHAASVEDVDYRSPRGLDRALF